jgi:hypothetical protein
MPIQPTTQFIEVNGVNFPLVDPTSIPTDNINFGADALFNMWIYQDDGVNPAFWVTPTTQELIDNVPNYIDNDEKVFTLLSDNGLSPTLQSFKLIKKRVALIQTGTAFWYQGMEIDKPLNSDTISPTDTAYNLFPNTIYTVTIK